MFVQQIIIIEYAACSNHIYLNGIFSVSIGIVDCAVDSTI